MDNKKTKIPLFKPCIKKAEDWESNLKSKKLENEKKSKIRRNKGKH